MKNFRIKKVKWGSIEYYVPQIKSSLFGIFSWWTDFCVLKYSGEIRYNWTDECISESNAKNKIELYKMLKKSKREVNYINL